MDQNAQEPKRYFSKSLLSLREKLSQREQARGETPPSAANILRKRCFVGDLGDAVVEKKQRTSSPEKRTIDATPPKPDFTPPLRAADSPIPQKPSLPSLPSPPSPSPAPSLEAPFASPAPSFASPALPLPASSLSRTISTTAPRSLEKIEKLPSSHLEICVKPWVDLRFNEVKEAIEVFRDDFLNGNGDDIDWDADPRLGDLREKVQSFHYEGGTNPEMPHCHLYKLAEEGPVQARQGEEVSMIQQWNLPNQEFHEVWQNLMYDSDIKNRLLLFASSLAIFGEHQVNPSVISNNRVILLYGPPGTGKTSLCKALAQKLAVRMSSRYQKPAFVEVNAHSLFSKWFSESGKLVTKLFTNLRDQLEDEETFLFVLVDEVESLTSARKSALSGSEPSDSIRAVNALLTQLDQLSTSPNVLILTTSNITEAIDAAFVDRADVKQFIGLPSHFARYQILGSCVNELKRTEIVTSDVDLLPFAEAKEKLQEDPSSASSLLYEIAESCEGLSGRSLRKLPLITHALCGGQVPVPIMTFLNFLKKYADEQKHSLIPTA